MIGLGFGWWGDTGVLLKLTGLPMGFYVSSVLAVHIVSVACIAGGVLVLANPQAGGGLMLMSAIGWLVLVAMLGGGIGTSMAVLIGVSAGGGALAFVPNGSRPLLRFNRPDDMQRQLERPQRVPIAPPPPPEQPAYAYGRPHDWSAALYEQYEDHSRPYEAPPMIEAFQPTVSDEDRRDFGRGHQIKGGQLQPIRYKVPQRQSRRERARQRDRDRDGEPRRRNGAGIFALLVLLVGVPTVLAIDYLNHSGKDSKATSVAAAETPKAPEPVKVAAAEPKAASSAEPASAAIDVPERLTPTRGLPLAAGTEAAATGVAEASPAALPMPAPVATSFASPFEYCESLAVADEPDLKRLQSGLPQELIDGVREVTKIPDGEVHWRCMSNAVWLCVQPKGGVACGKVPTAAQREAYCAAHPDRQDIAAAAGEWSCDGTTPVVPGGQDRTTDGRGFDRLAWLSLSRAPAVPAGMGGAVAGAG